MDRKREEIIKELEESYKKYDERFPSWLRERRLFARRVFREFEERGFPVGRFGMEFDLLLYRPDIITKHHPRQSLSELEDDMKMQAELAGQRIDEEYRAGSKLQEDDQITYLRFTPACLRTVLMEHPEGLVVMNIEEAACKYSWIEKLWNNILPVNLDKFTAYNSGYSKGGVFVWVKEGVKVDLPLQACFFLETEMYSQLPHIVVIAEPYSKIHIISGCVTRPACKSGLHGCITEIYAGKGSEVIYTMIHNFRPGFHAIPKIGAIVEEDATYIENFIIIGPCLSEQAYPTAILRGKGARAVIRCIILGLGSSDIDVGSAIIFAAPKTRGEVISRTIATEESKIKMRGTLKAYSKDVRGHLECRSLLLSPKARAWAYPQLRSTSPDANLTHEAAIGRIAEEQLYYLMSRGLTESEATSMIARGFLDIETPGLPPLLREEVNKVISMTLKKVL